MLGRIWMMNLENKFWA